MKTITMSWEEYEKETLDHEQKGMSLVLNKLDMCINNKYCCGDYFLKDTFDKESYNLIINFIKESKKLLES